MAQLDEQLSILLERAARYRGAARTVDHEQTKDILLELAAGYVSLARLLIDACGPTGGSVASDALLPAMPLGGEGASRLQEPA